VIGKVRQFGHPVRPTLTGAASFLAILIYSEMDVCGMEIHWPPAPDSFDPSPERFDVWAVPLDEGYSVINKLEANLSAAERQRAAGFRIEEPRKRFVVSRAALRILLGRYLGRRSGDVTLESNPSGKPRLAAGQRAVDLQFNVAHSGDLALIGITVGCEVGVDIERVRSIRHAEHIARRFFHPIETEAILAAPHAERDAIFMRCWTGKEAVLKTLGSGITGSLASFKVPTDEFIRAYIELPSTLSHNHSSCWLHALTPCQGYVGAAACLADKRQLRLFAFDL
jgi:4'-phosphopantetheinyl transferase